MRRRRQRPRPPPLLLSGAFCSLNIGFLEFICFICIGHFVPCDIYPFFTITNLKISEHALTMAPLIRAQILYASLSGVTAQSPSISSLVQIPSQRLLAVHRGPAAISPPSRCFWWGRHGYRSKYSSGIAAYHKCLEARSRVAKSKTTKEPPLHRSSYPIYYLHGHGWRLASSWGKSKDGSNEIPSDKSKNEANSEREWKSETEKWQEELNTYVERLKKQLESHPYETLFGASTKNGVWNPWSVDWDDWMRNLGWKDASGGESNRPKAETTEQASWRAAVQEYKEGQTSKQTATSPLSKKPLVERGDIDLITLRRIQKDTPEAAAANDKSNDSTRYDIPVKKFKVTEIEQKPPPSPANVTKPLATPSKAWLAKEGFSEGARSTNNNGTPDRRTDKSAPTTIHAQNRRLESSLERHLRTVSAPTGEPNCPGSALPYKLEENRTEDIDLLRASNVRAAAGHLKRPSQEATETREERWKTLQTSSMLRQQETDEILAREVGQGEVAKGQSQFDKLSKSSAARQYCGIPKQAEGKDQGNSLIFEGLNLNKISSEEKPPPNTDAWGYDLAPRGLETAYQDELDNKIQSLENYYARQQQELIEAEEQRMAEKRKRADAALVEEIKVQKAAMIALEDRRCGGGQIHKEDVSVHSIEADVASKVPMFAGVGQLPKQKVHPAIQQDGQKANDARLVREIRQIYEETYGNINTQHRQPGGVLTLEGREDPAVQKGLRVYDEKAASGDGNSGIVAQVSLADLEQSAVQASLKEYDEKIAAEDYLFGKGGKTIPPNLEDKAVQDGLRKYDEKTAKEEKTLGMTGRFASTELEDPAVQEGLRDYDEKIAAEDINLGLKCTVQQGPRDYEEKVPAKDGILDAKDVVQEGLRDYDGYVAVKEGPECTVQEGLHDYDRKVTAQELKLGPRDVVQEGLRHYDEKIVVQENTTGANSTVVSTDVEDQAVHEGLREYEEKSTAEAAMPPTNGRIASTDLDSREIALLGARGTGDSKTKTPPNPSLASEDRSPQKVRPAMSTYKVLAYDPTTDSIATATTTSSLHESVSAPRSASSILTHLENPAKYFDHFEPLEAAGFELVAGSRRALVFKKTGQDDRSDLKATRTMFDKHGRAESPALAPTIGNLEIPERGNVQPRPLELHLKQTEGVQSNVNSVQLPAELSQSLVDIPAARTDMAKAPFYTSNRSGDAETQRNGRDAKVRSEEEREELKCLRDPVNPLDGKTAKMESTDYNTDATTAHSAEIPASKASSRFSILQAQTPVRREEEVFSGHNIAYEQRRERKRQRRLITLALRDQESRENSRRKRQRIWRFVKRFIWNGAWVAGCFYLVGALLEEVYRPRKTPEAVVKENGEGKGEGKGGRTYEYSDASA